MKTILIMLLCLLMVIPVRATEPVAFCDAIAVIFSTWGTVPEWSSGAAARSELPGDFRSHGFIYLTDPTLPDDQVQALMFEYSAERNEMWVFAFWSMAYRDGGNHDLCPIRKLRLP